MILALMAACTSAPEIVQIEAPVAVQQAESLFMQECQKPSSAEVATTRAVLFERIGSTDCLEVHQYLSTTTSLDLSNHPTPFSDISMLSEFTQIEELVLSDSLVSDLSPIAGYKRLRTLHLEHCPIKDIAPLSELFTLEEILLDYTDVFELSSIRSLSSLKRLGLRKTQVTSLVNVSELTALKSLEISGTSITSIDELSALSQLQVLSLREVNMSDLKPIQGLSDLSFLDLNQTNVVDIDPLKDLSKMTVLDISNTRVTNIRPLQPLSDMIELNVQGLQLNADDCRLFPGVVRGCTSSNDDPMMRLCTDPDDFPFATQASLRSLQKDLQETDCGKIKTKIEGISTFTSKEAYPDPRIFSYFPKLQKIDIPLVRVFYEYCTENTSAIIKNLCVKKQSLMQKRADKRKEAFLQSCQSPTESTEVTYNALQLKMNVMSCEDLWEQLAMAEKLSLQGLSLTNIEPLGLLPNLQELSVDYNDITNLSPLSQATDLQILWIDDNQITDLSPLHDLPLLWLSAGDNQIMDVSALANATALQRLWLGGNQITDVSPLEKLQDLQKLHLAVNQIEDISPLSSLSTLSTLYLGYNNIRDIQPLMPLSRLHVLSSGLDNAESPLERQRWFLKGNPIEPQLCPKENAPSAVMLFCSQYH